MTHKNKNSGINKKLPVLMAAVFCAVIISTVIFMFTLSVSEVETVTPVKVISTQPEVTEPPVPYVVNTVTIGSAGDVLLHLPLVKTAKTSDGSYNFESMFKYVKPSVEASDYFIANLETTLAGTENGRKYTGFPFFNSPDGIVTSLQNVGVDCFLTANNHTYDTKGHGVKRTLSVIKNAGMDSVGTRENETDKRYLVKDIGGIKFGIGCYTYETVAEKGVSLNGNPVDSETAKLINSFSYKKLDSFYKKVEADLTAMKSEGAEVTVIYLHWGNEYQLEADENQKKIAKKLCDLGVDAIIGAHPHVVQPVDLITSTDGTHKTVCAYSLGNMISNQRKHLMGLKTGHTEDGLFFKMTFEKYSDGTVVFDSVKSIATWVKLVSNEYTLIPLSSGLEKKADEIGLTTSNLISQAQASYKRTMKLVKSGTKECNEYLASLPRPDDIPEETTAAASPESVSDDITDVAA